jgi:hypothetical protein
MVKAVRTMAWVLAVLAAAAFRLQAVRAAQAPPLDEQTVQVAAAWHGVDDTDADDPADEDDDTPAARAEDAYEEGTDALD